MNYAFRVTTPFDTLPNTIEAIAKSSDVLVVYEHHDANRVHIHGYVEGLTISTDTFKNWIKKELGVTEFPRSDWEFATKIAKGTKKGQPVDRDSLFYFHKGKYPILYNKGMPDEVVTIKHGMSEAFYNRPEQIQTQINEVIVVDKKKSERPTQYAVAQEVICSLMNHEDGTYETKVMKYIEKTIEVLKRNRILAHKRIVANIVQDIRAEFDKTRYMNEIFQMI